MNWIKIARGQLKKETDFWWRKGEFEMFLNYWRFRKLLNFYHFSDFQKFSERLYDNWFYG